MKRNGNSAFSIMAPQITPKINFLIPKLIISFKKYLKTRFGQSVLEYSLLLIVVAAVSMAVFMRVGRLGDPEHNMFRDAVTTHNTLVGGLGNR